MISGSPVWRGKIKWQAESTTGSVLRASPGTQSTAWVARWLWGDREVKSAALHRWNRLSEFKPVLDFYCIISTSCRTVEGGMVLWCCANPNGWRVWPPQPHCSRCTAWMSCLSCIRKTQTLGLSVMLDQRMMRPPHLGHVKGGARDAGAPWYHTGPSSLQWQRHEVKSPWTAALCLLPAVAHLNCLKSRLQLWTYSVLRKILTSLGRISSWSLIVFTYLWWLSLLWLSALPLESCSHC